MKTLKENTTEFLNEVKSVLDNATWSYQACNPSGNYTDTEKACDYLHTQKFSLSKIKEELNDSWETIIERLRDRREKTINTMEENAEIAAKMIAASLGHDRVSRFVWTYRDQYSKSKKWWIDETVILEIV